jgi:hypothetical protein
MTLLEALLGSRRIAGDPDQRDSRRDDHLAEFLQQVFDRGADAFAFDPPAHPYERRKRLHPTPRQAS